MGNRTRLIEADGTVTLYEHDGVYRLSRVTENFRPGEEPGNDVNTETVYSYDARGLLTEIINADKAATAFAYNGAGRLIEEVNPLGMTWTYTYDGMGNRISRKDGKGALTAYAFYPDDLLQSIAYSDGTAVSYAYDADNRRIQMNDQLGETRWSYDPLNRITGQNDPFDRVLASSYDAASNRTGMTYPDGNQVGYQYSPNNWLQRMTVRARHAVPQQTEYSRDLVGNVTGIVNPNQTETAIEYDRVYRTIRRGTARSAPTGGNNTISAFEYTYNQVGHIQRRKSYCFRL